LRAAHDLGVHVAQERGCQIDVFALPRSKTQVMKTYAGLLEIFGPVLGIAWLDSNSGPSANPVHEFIAFVHFLETEEWQELLVEFNGGRKTCHR
jgi:hypothetical protein